VASTSPAQFARVHFGWTPYAYQADVMDAVFCHAKRRIAWVAGRRVGKTETMANIVLQYAVKNPGSQAAILAPSLRQALYVLERAKKHLEGSIFIENVVVNNSAELRLRFGYDDLGKPIESVIRANSLASQVRGEGADLLIVDESAYCDSEDYRTKAYPFVADRAHGIIIHISTVAKEDDHFSEALRDYPKLAYGATFLTPTRMNPRVTEETMAEYRRTMTFAEFQRECECKLVPEGGPFDRQALKACMLDYPLLDIEGLEKLERKRHHKYFIGVDWGKMQDRAVIAVVEQPEHPKPGPARLALLQVYEPDPKNPHHYTRVLEDVQRVARQVEAARVLADEGEGAHQAEVLRKALGGRFEPYRFTGRSRDALVDKARALVERRQVVLPFEPEGVRKAFLNVQRSEAGYTHASRRSKDVFDAIALALHPADEVAAAAREPMRLMTPERQAGSWVLGPQHVRDDIRNYVPRSMWPYLKPERENGWG
jgi:hypothetical protein